MQGKSMSATALTPRQCDSFPLDLKAGPLEKRWPRTNGKHGRRKLQAKRANRKARASIAFTLATALVASQAFFAGVSRAEDYPTHAVRIIVPFGAGGPADVA